MMNFDLGGCNINARLCIHVRAYGLGEKFDSITLIISPNLRDYPSQNFDYTLEHLYFSNK